jgi:hypothetical protein
VLRTQKLVPSKQTSSQVPIPEKRVNCVNQSPTPTTAASTAVHRTSHNKRLAVREAGFDWGRR